MLLKTLKISFLVSLFFFVFLLGFFPKNASAEKCEDSSWSEDCHSLRPFPGQLWWPETKAPIVHMCGNTIFVTDPIKISVSPFSVISCPGGGGGYVCDYSISRKFRVAMDMSESELPIMGNTEDVINRVTTEEAYDDVEKVNDYVSWYLNGVINRAEYPFLDMEIEEDNSKLVNLSGPIKKLLPFDLQRNRREKIVEMTDSNNSPKEGELPNQIIVCKKSILSSDIVECYPSNGIEKRTAAWEKHMPPDRSDYDNFVDYYYDYREWKGFTCITLGKVKWCFDNPFISNFFGLGFPYIPFSSTEDRPGEGAFYFEGGGGDGVKVVDPKLDPEEPSATLFFAHMVESDQLASVLMGTYVPKGVSSSKSKDIVPPTIGAGCKILETRNGDGDNLFASPQEVYTNFSYTAEFECTFSQSQVDAAIKNFANLECTKNPTLVFPVITETPLADSVWEKLVAGTASVFRRIFPKTGTESPIYGVHDIPGSTKVTYSSTASLRYNEGEIYFPHIGGIDEYLLKGIQTALRPKGFGEQVLSGQPNPGYTEPINCNQSASAPAMSNTVSKEVIYDIALRWVGGSEGNHVMECYNDVVSRSVSKGINPAFALTIWLNESNASNYNVSVQDFGINDSSVYRDFNAQIDRFHSLVNNPKYTSCMNNPAWNTPMEGFLSVFRSGKCDPNDPRVIFYIDAIKPVFQWVAPGCPFPSSPTDMSCY